MTRVRTRALTRLFTALKRGYPPAGLWQSTVSHPSAASRSGARNRPACQRLASAARSSSAGWAHGPSPAHRYLVHDNLPYRPPLQTGRLITKVVQGRQDRCFQITVISGAGADGVWFGVAESVHHKLQLDAQAPLTKPATGESGQIGHWLRSPHLGWLVDLAVAVEGNRQLNSGIGGGPSTTALGFLSLSRTRNKKGNQDHQAKSHQTSVHCAVYRTEADRPPLLTGAHPDPISRRPKDG